MLTQQSNEMLAMLLVLRVVPATCPTCAPALIADKLPDAVLVHIADDRKTLEHWGRGELDAGEGCNVLCHFMACCACCDRVIKMIKEESLVI